MSGVSFAVSTGDAYAIGWVTFVGLASLIGWHLWSNWRDRRKGVTRPEVDPDIKRFVRIYQAFILASMFVLPVGVILLLPNVLAAVLLFLGWLLLSWVAPYTLRHLVARRSAEGDG